MIRSNTKIRIKYSYKEINITVMIESKTNTNTKSNQIQEPNIQAKEIALQLNSIQILSKTFGMADSTSLVYSGYEQVNHLNQRYSQNFHQNS